MTCARSCRAVAVVVGIAALAPLAAQCDLQWQDGLPVAGVDGVVHASLRWDPDGAGPQSSVVVLGGTFGVAGGVVAPNVVTWDPATRAFAPLGAGLGIPGFDSVRALAVDNNGELLAGGGFLHSGAVVLENLARWSGTAWSAFGVGPQQMLGLVRALAPLPSGDVLVGGAMTVFATGPTSIPWLASWNGASWQAIAGGGVDHEVHALVPIGNGEVLVAGRFSLAGGASANGLARWTGSSWITFAGGFGPQTRLVNAVVPLANGDFVAGGTFTLAGATSVVNVARWNGSAWSSMAGGLPAGVSALGVMTNGDVLAAGPTAPSIAATSFVHRWTGTIWAPFATVAGSALQTLLPLPGGALVLGGDFTTVSGAAAKGVAHFDGAQWTATAAGATGAVRCSLPLANGDVVVGGAFSGMGTLASNLALRTGSTWTGLGGGTNGPVNALAVLPNDRIVAAGAFTTAGSAPALNVASWDGTSWSPMGIGLGSAGEQVFALAVLADGSLFAGGVFGNGLGYALARWDGQAWWPVGGANNVVYAMLALPGNELVVGGAFSAVGGVTAQRVARWNGTSWGPLGTGVTGIVRALARASNGDLLAATNTGVERWNGVQWTQLGATTYPVHAVECLPNGDVVAGGVFGSIGGVAASCVARWRAASATWSPLGAGTNAGLQSAGVRTLRVLGDDAVLAGGGFTVVDGAGATAVVELRPTCVATVASVGAGCAGLGGVNVLVAATDPWLGTAWRTTATGLASGAFGVRALGLTTQSTPLASLTPLGGAGCDLLVSPDLLDAHWLAGGPLALDLPIPSASALVGATFHQQVFVAELAPAGAITRLTSTNALSATIGTW